MGMTWLLLQIGLLGAVAGDSVLASSPSNTRVAEQAAERGFAFYPSTPRLHGFRFALGGYYDAIDPQEMYGFNLRLPQLSLDARYGLGRGFSLKGHFNSMLVVNELLVGGSYAHAVDRWSFEASA